MPNKLKEKTKKSVTTKSRGRKEDGIVNGASKSKATINIILGQDQKSPHVINLKNPHQELFDNNYFSQKQSFGFKAKTQTSPPLKPPKPTPKRAKKIGVDFISGEKINRPAKFLPEKKNEIMEEEIEDIFARPSYFQFSKLYIPRNWYKQIAIFIMLAIVLILPLQAFTYYQDLQDTRDRILLITNEAIDNLKSGQQAITEFNLNDASSQFGQAKNNFAVAQKEINALNFLTSEILKLLPGQSSSVAAGLTLVEAGEIVADTGQILITSGQNFLNGGSITDYYNALVNFQNDLKLAIDRFSQATEKIKGIKPSDLPAEHQETFEKVLGYLPAIKKGLVDLYDINGVLLKILGHSQWQRYLLVFLNNNELRGGGGFMGSFGVIDIDRGEIKKLEIPGGGTYAIQGQLIPKVISPEPIHLINSRWEFQDANWWPDFPTTAKKIQWFYQNANGPSVDGVIAITSTLMERLLDIFGPISMPEYGRDITSDNFVLETQKIVELEYDKEENRPKQFISDFAPKLLEKIFSAKDEELKKLFEILKTGLNEKHLLIYFNDNQIEDLVAKFGWDAKLRQADSDFLAVIHTNLAGGKTDGVIKETIDHQAEVQEDGSIIDTVKLTRRHTGIPNENIFTGVQNNSYVRFYVPLGSTLLAADGFKKPPEKLFDKPQADYQKDLDLISVESDHAKDQNSDTDIYKEGGKTVFGNWLQLKPGEVQEATIKYRLPFKLALEGQNNFYYSLLAQKQAGSLGSELRSYLKLNNSLKLLAKFPANLPSDDNGVGFNALLNTDQFYGVALINK